LFRVVVHGEKAFQVAAPQLVSTPVKVTVCNAIVVQLPPEQVQEVVPAGQSFAKERFGLAKTISRTMTGRVCKNFFMGK